MAEKDTREEIIGTTTIDLNAFLETCLVSTQTGIGFTILSTSSSQDKPGTFTLNDSSGNRSTVVIAAKYIPVDIVLEARESVNSQSLSARSVLLTLIFLLRVPRFWSRPRGSARC